MTENKPAGGAWFAPKRYGYGSGMPIAWQGWALCAAYLAVLGGTGYLDAIGQRTGHGSLRITALVLFVAATAGFMAIVARRTRGGWRWRWGSFD